MLRIIKLSLISIALLTSTAFFCFGAEESGCISCHRGQGGDIQLPVTLWERSIHKQAGVSCHDCHGGNPKIMDDTDRAMYGVSSFIGVPQKKQIPGLCAKCHSDVNKMRKYNLRTDQYDLYKTSVHGKRLYEKGDTNVAVCSSCHGAHDIKKINDPSSSVYHTNVPETCGKCHANKKLMDTYGIPSNQLAQYKEGYHGQILYGRIPGKNPALVPNCATCHGIHGATPPGVKEIAEVCGNCHSTIVTYFKEGPHYAALQKVGGPKCYDCHGNHRNRLLTPEMFQGSEAGHCGACHGDSDTLDIAKEIHGLILDTKENLDGAEKAMKSIENSGRNMQDLEDLFNQAKTFYTEIGPMTHALSAKRIKELNVKVVNNTDKIQKLIADFHANLEQRKKNLIYYLVIIFAILVMLYMKYREVSKGIEVGGER